MRESPLSASERNRYQRHLALAEVGKPGQERLKAARVLVIGAGGLGSPAAMYLAAAGVGTLGIVDCDRVELSNLQRQILHATSDIGKDKVESAKATINALNPDIEVKTYATRFAEDNATEIVSGYNFIVDGSDNFDTKFLVNDTAIRLNIAFSHAGIVRLQGQTMTVLPRKSACYRCLFQAPPAPEEILNCQQSGILGAVAGTLGTIQATEAIKYLAGFEEEGLITDRLLTYDAKLMRFHSIDISRNPQCAACGAASSVNPGLSGTI